MLQRLYRIVLFFLAFIFCETKILAQQNVGIGTTTPDATSILHLESNNKGLLTPRVTTAQRLAIVNPANGLLVYDTNVDCFFYYIVATTSWQSMCGGNGTSGSNALVSTAIEAAGANCANGGVVINSGTDSDNDGILDPSEISSTQYVCNGAAGSTGSQGPVGPQGVAGVAGAQGTAGTNGINCWDVNGNGVNDPSEDINTDGNFNSLDCQGATGPQGVAGTNGISCWDVNGNGVNDPSEDINSDGSFNVLDCQGAGSLGPQGPAGVNGINCWDVNGNGVNDPTEDTNLDGNFNSLDCQGPAGTAGATGPQGPSGVINRFHVYGTAGRLAVTSTAATLQPGLTQTFTLAAPATVIVWATIGGRTTGTTSGSYANIDMIIYLNNNFLPNGGWNRFSITNPTLANAFNTCAINTIISLPAGTHTIDLRTARSAGNVSVDIGGNSATDVNPGELTILILN